MREMSDFWHESVDLTTAGHHMRM